MNSMVAGARTLLVLASAVCSMPAIAGMLPGDPIYEVFEAEAHASAPPHFYGFFDPQRRYLVSSAEQVLLRYGGSQWEQLAIDVPGDIGQMLHGMSEDGALFVAGHGGFGRLSPAKGGAYAFQDMRPALGISAANADIGGTPYYMYAAATGVYFTTERRLFFLQSDGAGGQSWTLPEGTRFWTWFVHGTVYAKGAEGLFRLTGGTWEAVPGWSVIAEREGASAKVMAVVADGDSADAVVVVTQAGMYRLNGTTAIPEEGSFPNQWERYRLEPYVRVPGAGLVGGGRNGGLMHYGEGYRLLERIELPVGKIWDLKLDHEGGLWVAGHEGLARVSGLGRWSVIGKAQGLPSQSVNAEWHLGQLYVGGADGVRRARVVEHQTVIDDPLPIAEDDSADSRMLVSTPKGLLVGTAIGVSVLDAGATTLRRLVKPGSQDASDRSVDSVDDVILSAHDPSRAYAKGVGHLYVLSCESGRWELVGRHKLPDAQRGPLVEVAQDRLLSGNAGGWPTAFLIEDEGRRVRLEAWQQDRGLPDEAESNGVLVFSLGNRVVAHVGERTFELHRDRFAPVAHSPLPPVRNLERLVHVESELGVFAISGREAFWRPRSDRDWRALHHELPRNLRLLTVAIGSDGIVRFGTPKGLFQLDPSVAALSMPPLDVRIAATQVRFRSDTEAAVAPDGKTVEVPSGSVVEVTAEATTFGAPPAYRWRVPGIFDDWSEWSRSGTAIVKADTPGGFTLDLQAQAIDGRIGSTSLPFHVAPAWHQRWDIRAGLGLLSILLIALVGRETMRLRSRKLASENASLQEAVTRRTHEVTEITRRLTDASTVDALTELPNRRSLERGLRREWLRCLDASVPLSIIVVEIDHLSRLNDRVGMLEADRLIKQLAYELAQHHDPLRQVFGRYSGSRFVLVTPGDDTSEMEGRAAALSQISRSSFDEFSVTVAGISTRPVAGSDYELSLQSALSAVVRRRRGESASAGSSPT